MIGTIHCRICGKAILCGYWDRHEIKHKLEYGRMMRYSIGKSQSISFEECVRYYNPSATKTRQILNEKIKPVKRDVLKGPKFKKFAPIAPQMLLDECG